MGTYAGEVAGHVVSAQATKGEKRVLSKAEIDTAVLELNRSMKLMGTKLEFSVDSITKRPVVTVVDAETHEVIRQIPSEEMLKVSQRITELLGVLFDQAG